MTNLNYKEIEYKDPKFIVGAVESARPELFTKPCTHYVFKLETVDGVGKSSISQPWVWKWHGRVIAKDGTRSSAYKDVMFSRHFIGTEVTAKEVMAELLKSLNAAVPYMKVHDHVCTTIELFNSHIGMTDFNNAYADDIGLLDQKLCGGKLFWIDDAKTMSQYN